MAKGVRMFFQPPKREYSPLKLRLVQKRAEGGGSYPVIYLNGIELRLLGGDDGPVLTFVRGQAYLRCTIVAELEDG